MEAVQEVQAINMQSDLQQFINGLITDTTPRFGTIVENSYLYKITKKSIDETLAKNFNEIEIETQKFQQCRKVHEFEQTFRFEDFQREANSSELEVIKGLFEVWTKWEGDVAKYISPKVEKGLLRADGKKLRDSL